MHPAFFHTCPYGCALPASVSVFVYDFTQGLVSVRKSADEKGWLASPLSVCLSVWEAMLTFWGEKRLAGRSWAGDRARRPAVSGSLWNPSAFGKSIWRNKFRHGIQMNMVRYIRLSISVNSWEWTPVGRGRVLLIAALWRWLRQVWTSGERRSMEEAAFWNGQMDSQDKKEVKKEKNRPTLRSGWTIR